MTSVMDTVADASSKNIAQATAEADTSMMDAVADASARELGAAVEGNTSMMDTVADASSGEVGAAVERTINMMDTVADASPKELEAVSEGDISMMDMVSDGGKKGPKEAAGIAGKEDASLLPSVVTSIAPSAAESTNENIVQAGMHVIIYCGDSKKIAQVTSDRCDL